MSEEFITVEELARRLNYEPKTIRNKMGTNGIFKKGVHYSAAQGLPIMFRWSAVLALYSWKSIEPTEHEQPAIPMARGYVMK